MAGGASEHSSDNLTLRRTNLQEPCLPKELGAANGAQFGPKLVGPQNERHIIGMLKIRLSNDARLTMRAAAPVSRRKAIDGQHA
jgi:hypothetical protein